MTAVLIIRADEERLPIMFIVRDTPGGRIETSELAEYKTMKA
ncbi:hypothetical protein PR003_g15244 [Phytophthora rubi]|uniref:Uncharacterized protein n=1 Tax=Phytophthora rubi TaxID=129364 RepID=A0A6A3LG89_9STRA|nr:hypothetical protein PR002_g14598 [Phytophthora rubi]KAE9017590.1 hypothetical protein PR001_g14353 [Phytophthora rubi]KAE9330757.1 hypothetical protein PR003_g15244 [Phytophthora rubi]